jgi:hypothetical protein
MLCRRPEPIEAAMWLLICVTSTAVALLTAYLLRMPQLAICCFGLTSSIFRASQQTNQKQVSTKQTLNRTNQLDLLHLTDLDARTLRTQLPVWLPTTRMQHTLCCCSPEYVIADPAAAAGVDVQPTALLPACH